MKLAQYLENTTERGFDTTEVLPDFNLNRETHNFNLSSFEDDISNATPSTSILKTYSHFPESKNFSYKLISINNQTVVAAINSDPNLIRSKEDDAPFMVTNQSVNHILSIFLPLVLIALLITILVLLRVPIIGARHVRYWSSRNRVHPQPEIRLFTPGRVLLLQDKDGGGKGGPWRFPDQKNTVNITDVCE